VTCQNDPLNKFTVCHGEDVDVGAAALTGEFLGTDPANRRSTRRCSSSDLTINGIDRVPRRGASGRPEATRGSLRGLAGGGLAVLPNDVFGTWKVDDEAV